MKLYLGIGDMPIYNFDKVLNTNDYRYLLVKWDERKEVEVPESANDRWKKIYNEYCERTAGNEALDFYSLSCEVAYMQMRFVIVSHLVFGLSEATKESYGKELNAWRVPFNTKGSIKKQIPNLERYLKILKQNLDMKSRKLSALKDKNVEQTTLLKQVIIINEKLGVKINIKKDSVDYFLTALDRLKEKLQQEKKNG